MWWFRCWKQSRHNNVELYLIHRRDVYKVLCFVAETSLTFRTPGTVWCKPFGGCVIPVTTSGRKEKAKIMSFYSRAWVMSAPQYRTNRVSFTLIQISNSLDTKEKVLSSTLHGMLLLMLGFKWNWCQFCYYCLNSHLSWVYVWPTWN